MEGANKMLEEIFTIENYNQIYQIKNLYYKIF